MTKVYTSSGYTETVKTRWGTDEKTFNHHWGITLDQAEPTTGVYNGNDLDWEYMPYDWIDLDYETAVDDIMERDDLDDEEKDDAIDELSNGFDSGDTHLYGSWKKVDGQYEADKDTDDPEDFTAIYNANYNTLQVVWSRVIRYGVLASPCYPGQVSADDSDTKTVDNTHVQAYYALPDGCIYTDAKHQRDRAMILKRMEDQDTEKRRNQD